MVTAVVATSYLWQYPPSHSLRQNEYINPDFVATWDIDPAVQQYLTDARAETSYHMPIAIEDTVSSLELVNEANGYTLYSQLLVCVGRVIVGRSFRAIVERRSSRISPSPYIGGLLAMASGSSGSGAALDPMYNSAIRLDIVLMLGYQNIVIVEMKSGAFFRTRGLPTESIVDLVLAYRHRDDVVVSEDKYPVLA